MHVLDVLGVLRPSQAPNTEWKLCNIFWLYQGILVHWVPRRSWYPVSGHALHSLRSMHAQTHTFHGCWAERMTATGI